MAVQLKPINLRYEIRLKRLSKAEVTAAINIKKSAVVRLDRLSKLEIDAALNGKPKATKCRSKLLQAKIYESK